MPGPGNVPGGTPDPGLTPPERMMSPACDGTTRPGPAPIRRLTRFEYDNTVRDLLGDTTAPGADFPTEERRAGFDNNAAALTVSPTLNESYLMAAERLATNAVTNLAPLNPTGCDLSKVDAACMSRFIADFGKKAYRGKPSPEETKLLEAVYAAGNTSGGPKNGVKLVLMTMLLSPRFLYRVELGAAPVKAGDAVVKLTSWEMASRLSYLVWSSMPDAELLAAAEGDKLQTREQIAAQVDRMWKDPKRPRQMVRNLYQQWMQLYRLATVEKDAKVYTTYNPANLATMKEETLRFVEHMVFSDPDGSLEALMTAPYTFGTKSLATLYGATMADPMAADMTKLSYPAGQQRGGLLMQGGLMTFLANANQSSPIHRGKFVREQIICQDLPSPPNDVQIELPPLSATLTTRERFEKHRTVAACAACHALIDPIGIGFENLDGIGRWRTTENGKPIDASGEVVGMTDGKFNGGLDLAKKLVKSTELQSCVVEKSFTFGYGREPLPEDACSVDVLKRRFMGKGMKLRDVILALAETDAFLYRRAGGGQ
jgi:hypothetical protein